MIFTCRFFLLLLSLAAVPQYSEKGIFKLADPKQRRHAAHPHNRQARNKWYCRVLYVQWHVRIDPGCGMTKSRGVRLAGQEAKKLPHNQPPSSSVFYLTTYSKREESLFLPSFTNFTASNWLPARKKGALLEGDGTLLQPWHAILS